VSEVIDGIKQLVILVAIQKKLSPQESVAAGLNVMPPFIPVRFPDDEFVALPVLVEEHDLFDLLSLTMSQGADVRTISSGFDSGCGFATSGHIVLTKFQKEQHPVPAENRVSNLYDFAWCTLPADADRSCLSIPDIGEIGPPRDVVELDEPVWINTRLLGRIQGTVSADWSEQAFKADTAHFFYMTDGFEVDFGSDGKWFLFAFLVVFFSPLGSPNLVCVPAA